MQVKTTVILTKKNPNYKLFFKEILTKVAVSIYLFCMPFICERLLELSESLWIENFTKVDDSLDVT